MRGYLRSELQDHCSRLECFPIRNLPIALRHVSRVPTAGYARSWCRAGNAGARYAAQENRVGSIAGKRKSGGVVSVVGRKKKCRGGALRTTLPLAGLPAGLPARPLYRQAAPRFLEELLLLNRLSEPRFHRRATGRSPESCRHRPRVPSHRHRRQQ